jgi:hypothetical protein
MKGDTVVELTPPELFYMGWFLDDLGLHKLGRRMIKSVLRSIRNRPVSFRMPKWQAYGIARYIIELTISKELFINDDFLFRDLNLFRAALKLLAKSTAKRGKRESIKRVRESDDRRTHQRARKRLKERMAALPAATDLGLFNISEYTPLQ